MEDVINRRTAKRKAAMVMKIIQGKTTVAEVSRSFDFPPSKIEEWVSDAKKNTENALQPGAKRDGRAGDPDTQAAVRAPSAH